MKVFLSRSVDRTNVLGITFPRIVEIMNVVLSCAKGKTDMVDRKDHQRGYFHVSELKDVHGFGLETQVSLLTLPFGEIYPIENEEKYFFLSEGKAMALSRAYVTDGHTTSFEGRCEDSKKHPPFGMYGGAILAIFSFKGYLNPAKFLFSFSGMPELIDEAMMLSFAQIVANLTSSALFETNAHERNQYWREIYEEAWKIIQERQQKDLF